MLGLISLYYLNICIFWRIKFGGEVSWPNFFGGFLADKKWVANSAMGGSLGSM